MEICLVSENDMFYCFINYTKMYFNLALTFQSDITYLLLGFLKDVSMRVLYIFLLDSYPVIYVNRRSCVAGQEVVIN